MRAGQEMITGSAASPSPQFPPVFFFRVRAFSIPRARPSRSLEQATQSGTKATKFFGAAVIFFVIINCLKLLNCPNRLLQGCC